MYYIGNIHAWQPIPFLTPKKLRFTAYISVVHVSSILPMVLNMVKKPFLTRCGITAVWSEGFLGGLGLSILNTHEMTGRIRGNG